MVTSIIYPKGSNLDDVMEHMKAHLMPQDAAVKAVTLMMEHLPDWPLRSAEAFRNTIMGDGMLAINPLLEINEEVDVDFLIGLLRKAVREGRMIDFGFIPNEILKTEAVRSREMFEAGEFQHPYDSWIGITSWEGGFNGYYITPHPMWEGAILAIELYGCAIPEIGDIVMVYDIISLKVEGIGSTRVSPAIMKYPPGHQPTDKDLAARGANSLDPLVTMLRLLADASVPVVHKPAPEKLNKARAKQGKYPIPGHTIVNTKDYVATFMTAARTARVSRGGHHAPPIPHWRRAHTRHLASGRVVPVKSSKVNWREAEELHRMFYRLPKEKPNGNNPGTESKDGRPPPKD